jgi:restriction endonuclease
VDDKQIKTALVNKTIEAHLDKDSLNPKELKVLGLFLLLTRKQIPSIR